MYLPQEEKCNLQWLKEISISVSCLIKINKQVGVAYFNISYLIVLYLTEAATLIYDMLKCTSQVIL